jgi:hypothetical protein
MCTFNQKFGIWTRIVMGMWATKNGNLSNHASVESPLLTESQNLGVFVTKKG